MPSGTVVTSRPSGTAQQGGWSRTGGSTYHGVLADDSNSTYLATTSSRLNDVDLTKLDVTDFTIPSGAKIFAVQVRYRVQGTSVWDPDAVYVWTYLSGAKKQWVNTVPYSGSAAWKDILLGYQTEKPGGGEWSAANVNALQVWLGKGTSWFGQEVRVSEVWVDVDYNERPTVTVTGPSGTLSDIDQPTVTWTWSDPEGDSQEAYEVEVRTSATPGAGTLLWTSGEVLSSATSRQVGVALPNGTYYAHVRARQQWEGVGTHWSATAVGASFTVNVSPPPVPSVTGTPSTTLARVLVTVTRGGASPATETFDVDVSDDAGTTWEPLRYGYGLVPDGSGVSTVYDYEAPPDVQRTYRTRANRTVNGNPVASAYGTGTATLTLDASWLKVPTDSTLNRRVRINQRTPTIRGRDVVLRPKGRRTAVVVSDVPGGLDDRLRILSTGFGTVEYEAVETLLVSTYVLLYQRANGTHRYIRIVGDRQPAEQGADENDLVYWDVDAVEVARP